MPLTMKDTCERCQTGLGHEADAFVCSYEVHVLSRVHLDHAERLPQLCR